MAKKENDFGINLKDYDIRKITSWKGLPKKYYPLASGNIYNTIYNFEQRLGRKLGGTIYEMGLRYYITDEKFIEDKENPLRKTVEEE